MPEVSVDPRTVTGARPMSFSASRRKRFMLRSGASTTISRGRRALSSRAICLPTSRTICGPAEAAAVQSLHSRPNLTYRSDGMELETLKDLYLEGLKDLYSAENQIVKALP